MAHPKFCSPFPRLELSLEDKRELCRIAKRLVGEVTEGYERFLWNDNAQLDPFRWALVKEKEDVRVYHDRHSGPRAGNPKALHVLMTVGTMQGSLDDAMYGVVNHTTEAMRIKSAYAKDTIVNGAVLATVLEPTADKPFRSMTVKWGVKSMPFAMRAVARNRDVVYVESVGTRTLANGERVGYQLVHSIDFKYAQPLPSYVRATVSSCALWRQQTPHRVPVLVKSFIDVPDGIMAPLIVRASADTLVSVWRGMHVAQMKKLAWLMQRRRASMLDDAPDEGDPLARCCAVCGSGGSSGSPSSVSMSSMTMASPYASFSHRSSRGRAAAKSTCTICNRYVCATCRVRRELCYITQPDRQLVERRVAFCVPCLSVTGRVSAADIARDEISGGRSAAVGPLSEIVKGCNSVTRFSYTDSSSPHTAVAPIVPYRGTPITRSQSGQFDADPSPRQASHTKRRSMTMMLPIKPKPSPSPSYAMSMIREASVPTPRMMSPAPKSSAWIRT